MLIKYFKDIYTTKSEYPYTIYIYIGKCFRKIKKNNDITLAIF